MPLCILTDLLLYEMISFGAYKAKTIKKVHSRSIKKAFSFI